VSPLCAWCSQPPPAAHRHTHARTHTHTHATAPLTFSTHTHTHVCRHAPRPPPHTHWRRVLPGDAAAAVPHGPGCGGPPRARLVRRPRARAQHSGVHGGVHGNAAGLFRTARSAARCRLPPPPSLPPAPVMSRSLVRQHMPALCGHTRAARAHTHTHTHTQPHAHAQTRTHTHTQPSTTGAPSPSTAAPTAAQRRQCRALTATRPIHRSLCGCSPAESARHTAGGRAPWRCALHQPQHAPPPAPVHLISCAPQHLSSAVVQQQPQCCSCSVPAPGAAGRQHTGGRMPLACGRAGLRALAAKVR
jgi:hypothetical protein